MPKITPGNRLYLYRLLSRSLGIGRQTLMPRVEEALTADELSPADLGCADMRELCEQLPEFVKLTVFKKGYVYATILANEEYDRALERSETAADKAAANGKPWKRKRGAKALKPMKPRHIEKVVEPEPSVADVPEPSVADVPEPAVAGVPEPVPASEEAPAGEKDGAVEAQPASERELETPVENREGTGQDGTPTPEVAAESEAIAEPEAVTEVAAPAAAEAQADAASEPEAQADAAAEPETAPAPETAPEPAPKPEHVPPIRFTITYVPEPTPEPEPAPESEPTPEPSPDHTPEPDPGPEPTRGQAATPTTGAAPVAAVTSRAQADLPRDFHAEVRCSSEQLSVLYQVLPADVDPMATLEEDFRVARSTGALEGTRSNVTFALRYLQADGVTPVRVTLRRSARAVAGKRWALTEVDAGAADEVGLEGLSVADPHGPWAAFLRPGDSADPGRDFAQTVSLGSHEEALELLAGLAKPEDWGEGRRTLSDYLTMTFARVRAEGGPTVAADGRAASFDTGLVTADGAPIVARLAASPSDIPWQLVGFSADAAEGPAPSPARYVSSLAQLTLDPALSAPSFSALDEVRRNPRVATPAYDPIANEVRLLVPDGGRALALAVTDSGYEAVATFELADAYACARVVSSEQPAWLGAGR